MEAVNGENKQTEKYVQAIRAKASIEEKLTTEGAHNVSTSNKEQVRYDNSRDEYETLG